LTWAKRNMVVFSMTNSKKCFFVSILWHCTSVNIAHNTCVLHFFVKSTKQYFLTHSTLHTLEFLYVSCIFYCWAKIKKILEIPPTCQVEIFGQPDFVNGENDFYWGNEYLGDVFWDLDDQTKIVRSIRVSSKLLFSELFLFM